MQKSYIFGKISRRVCVLRQAVLQMSIYYGTISLQYLISESENRKMDSKPENNIVNGEFENPSAKYRGFPFWAWNSELKKDELEEQIEIFKSMGFGGFFMHVRQVFAYVSCRRKLAVEHKLRKIKKNSVFCVKNVLKGRVCDVRLL